MIWKGGQMAKSLPQDDLVSFKKLLLASLIQVGALVQLLIEEGLISEPRFTQKLKEGHRSIPVQKTTGNRDSPVFVANHLSPENPIRVTLDLVNEQLQVVCWFEFGIEELFNVGAVHGSLAHCHFQCSC
jgi:hypothetical protein